MAWNVRRVLAKTPSRRHFESKRTSKTGSTSKIGSRNGFVRFGKFCIVRSLSPYGVLNSGHKLTVTYYGEITIEPILNPEFDVDHDFEVKNGCFQSLFPRFRVISVYSTGSDTDELVGGLIGSEGVLWPRLVADTVCGRLTRRSVGLVVCRGGL